MEFSQQNLDYYTDNTQFLMMAYIVENNIAEKKKNFLFIISIVIYNMLFRNWGKYGKTLKRTNLVGRI